MSQAPPFTHTVEVALREVRGRLPPQPDPILIRALPERVDLELYRGDDFGLAIRVWNADGSEADLSGFAVVAQVRAEVTAWDVAGVFGSNVEGNVIRLHLAGSVSEALPVRGVWDCRITDPGGALVTLVAGRTLMAGSVSR